MSDLGRQWALADLIMNAELAETFGGGRAVAVNWQSRNHGFPRAVRTLKMGRLLSYQQVADWWKDHLTPGRRKALIRFGWGDPETLPKPFHGVAATGIPNWDVDDLGGYAELCERFEVGKGVMTMWAYRREHTGFPDPLLVFSMGPVYSFGQVGEWIAERKAARPVVIA